MPPQDRFVARHLSDDLWEVTTPSGQQLYTGTMADCEMWLDFQEHQSSVAGMRSYSWRLVVGGLAALSAAAFLIFAL